MNETVSLNKKAEPKRSLRTIDIISLIVGTVVGAGIFKVPALVASQTQHEWIILGLWLFGGLISIIGALCYAELATAYPNVGGEYHFLQKAYGKNISFLYGWARSIIIVTGSLGILGITLGDYMTQIISLGTYSSTIWAMLTVIGLSLLNILGIKQGKTAQNILTLCEVGGILAIIVTGFLVQTPTIDSAGVAPELPSLGVASLAMVFVLLTFGGWNEAAYVSAEAIDQRRGILKALLLGIGLITLLLKDTEINTETRKIKKVFNLSLATSAVVFWTKPYVVNSKLTLSPQVFLMNSPISYNPKTGESTVNRQFFFLVGSSFDYKISKRFGLSLNYRALGASGSPILSNFLIGSRLML